MPVKALTCLECEDAHEIQAAHQRKPHDPQANLLMRPPQNHTSAWGLGCTMAPPNPPAYPCTSEAHRGMSQALCALPSAWVTPGPVSTAQPSPLLINGAPWKWNLRPKTPLPSSCRREESSEGHPGQHLEGSPLSCTDRVSHSLDSLPLFIVNPSSPLPGHPQTLKSEAPIKGKVQVGPAPLGPQNGVQVLGKVSPKFKREEGLRYTRWG